MRWRHRQAAVRAGAAVFAAVAVWGEETSTSTNPPVVVTARPVVEEVSIRRTADKVDAVTAEQLEMMNAHDLADGLRRVPGVSISRHNMVGSYGGGAGGGIYIRGHGSSRPGSEISTMMDGIARYNGVWTHPLLDTLSLDVADAIEVYKSPQPVRQGNMGFAGVNLVPRREARDGLHGRLYSAVGSHGTWIQRGELSGKEDDFDWLLSGSHRESRGHRDNSEGEVDSLFFHTGMALNENWETTFLYNRTDSWANDPEASGDAKPRTEQYNVLADFYRIALNNRYEKAHGSIKVYYEDGEALWKQWDDTPPPPVNVPLDHRNWYDNYGVKVEETLELEKGWLTLGLDHDYASGRTRDERPSAVAENSRKTLRNTAPWLQGGLRLGDAVKITPSAGVRYNDSRTHDNQTGWQAGITAEQGGTLLYANAARAFNYPGIYAAFISPASWDDLEPEKMDHFEIGVRQALSPHAELDVSLYRTDVENGISLAAPPPVFSNIGSYRSKGVEANLLFSPKEGLDCYAGMNFSETAGGKVPNAPAWSGTVGAGWQVTERLRTSLDAEYLGPRYVVNTRNPATVQDRVRGFTLVNLSARYRFTPKENRWTGAVFTALNNVLKESYEYQSGYRMPGITWMCGLDLGF